MLHVSHAQASTTLGIIDSTNKYAWGENIGWIDFNASSSAVTVSDEELTGYAFAENIGWISLNCSNTSSCGTVDYGVTNNSEGILTGYAWSENTGWIHFAPVQGGVTISDEGVFGGYAYGENIGWINFNTHANNPYPVTTDWRPESVRTNEAGKQTTSETSSSRLGNSRRTVTGVQAASIIVPHTTPPTTLPNESTTTPASPSTRFTFTRDLMIESVGDDVRALQDMLIAQGFLESGRSTGYFGVLTQEALIRYQETQSVAPASGYFGPMTRAVMNGVTSGAPVDVSHQNTTIIGDFIKFTRDLDLGMTGDDVRALQVFLNTNGFVLATSGPGSPGLETTRFGYATQNALMRYQQANNITPSLGYFGPKTRSSINSLLR